MVVLYEKKKKKKRGALNNTRFLEALSDKIKRLAQDAQILYIAKISFELRL